MDNLLQNREELQDEELYALLDKALTTERLCVSEELIQKTLKRVEEEENSKVISLEQERKRKLPAMKYISVAAAALFVAVLGVGVVRSGSFSTDSVEMEATYDKGARKTESLLADSAAGEGISVAENKDDASTHSHYYSSTNGGGDMAADAVEGETVVQEDRGMPKASDEADAAEFLEGCRVSISAELTEALTAVGAKPVSGAAEYWEFVQRDTTWEKELFKELAAAMDVFGEQLPENGTYRYRLEDVNDNGKTIYCEYPLDGIVRIETGKGVLWGLIGEKARFYTE